MPTTAQLRSEAVSAMLSVDAKVLHTIEGQPPLYWSFHPDNHWAATILPPDDGGPIEVRIADVASGKVAAKWNIHNDQRHLIGPAWAVSPDGKRVALGGGIAGAAPYLFDVGAETSKTAFTWPKESLPPGQTHHMPPFYLQMLTWSPCGKWLAGKGGLVKDGKIVSETFLWNVNERDQPRRLAFIAESEAEGPRPIFSPKGDLLVYQTGLDSVNVWDVANDRLLCAIDLKMPVRGHASIDHSGQWLAVPCGHLDEQPGVIIFWDLKHNREQARWHVETGTRLQQSIIAYHPAGTHLAVLTVFGKVQVYHTTGSKVLEFDEGPQDFAPMQHIGWLDGGKQLVTGRQSTVRVRDVSMDLPYSGLSNGDVRPWPAAVAVHAGLGVPATFPGRVPWLGLAASIAPDIEPFSAPVGIAFSRDDKWLAVTDANTVRLIHRETHIVEFVRPCSALRVLFDKDSRRLAAYGLTGVRVWEVPSGKLIAHMGTPDLSKKALFEALTTPAIGPLPSVAAEGVFTSVGFAPDGRILTLRSGGGGVFDVQTWQLTWELGQEVARSYLTVDGKLRIGINKIVVGAPPITPGQPLPGSGQPLSGTGQPLPTVTLPGLPEVPKTPSSVTPPTPVPAPASKPDIVVVPLPPATTATNADGKPVPVFQLPPPGMTLKDGVLTPNMARVQPPTLYFPLMTGYSDGTISASPDGTWFAINVEDSLPLPGQLFLKRFGSATKPRVQLWQMLSVKDPVRGVQETVLQHRELPLPARAVAHAFSPDNKLLAVGCSNGHILLWNVASGEELFQWQAHVPPIMELCLAFSPDGKELYGCDGNTSPAWRLELDHLRRGLAAYGLDW